MPDFNAQFWCEFAASLLVAVMWHAIFAFALRKKSVKDGQDASTADSGPVVRGGANGVLGFLREAVRLAEECLKAEDDRKHTLERKAMLLGTLCVFTVAFLLSGGFNAPGAFLFKLVAIVFLVLAATWCVRTIDLSSHGRPGFYAPGTIFGYVQNPPPDALAYLLRAVLPELYASIADNRKGNDKKADDLINAKCFWMIGTSLALGAVAGNSKAVQWAHELTRDWPVGHWPAAFVNAIQSAF